MLSSFIVWVLESPIFAAILKILWKDLSDYFQNLLTKHKQVLAAQAQAVNDVTPVKDAKTGDEVEKASDSNLNGV